MIPAESQALAADVADNGTPTSNASVHSGYAVHYEEGSEVGYKWYEVQHKQPLFAFGFGLSYTTYAYSGLSVDSATKTVRFTVKNTGKRAGTEIAEVYARLPKGADEPYKRLAGWKRVMLAPGESQSITIAIDDRVLQTFDEEKKCLECDEGRISGDGRWLLGRYTLTGDSCGSLKSLRLEPTSPCLELRV